MGQSYFIWKNVDCRAMGVKLQGPAAIIRPEERVQHVTIPGRSGDLTALEGEHIYNSYIQTVTIMAHGAARIRQIYDWLRGSGYVTFSGEPEKKQQARVIGAVTLDRHSYNLDWWVGDVQFYCQPLKEKLTEDPVTLTAAGTVRNTGDVDSRPMIKATASGTTMTITAGGKTLTLTGVTSGTAYRIDCDAMEVLSADGTTLLTNMSSGDFPVLKPGANSVTGSGWSRLEIERRERYL